MYNQADVVQALSLFGEKFPFCLENRKKCSQILNDGSYIFVRIHRFLTGGIKSTPA